MFDDYAESRHKTKFPHPDFTQNCKRAAVVLNYCEPKENRTEKIDIICGIFNHF